MDYSRQIDARDTAINIAEVCELSELQDELVNLALDSSESIHLRVSAASAIASIGDELGAGKSIEMAYKFGCNAIQLENISEHVTPQIKRKYQV